MNMSINEFVALWPAAKAEAEIRLGHVRSFEGYVDVPLEEGYATAAAAANAAIDAATAAGDALAAAAAADTLAAAEAWVKFCLLSEQAAKACDDASRVAPTHILVQGWWFLSDMLD